MAYKIEHLPIGKLKVNPENPRLIRDVEYICRTCGITFKSEKSCKSRNPVYCSWECYMKGVTIYAGMTFICGYCGKEFQTNKAYKGRIPKYCSMRCSGDSQKINAVAWNTGIKTGLTPWNKGKSLSAEIRKKLSDGRKNSVKCKGPNLYNWRGGEETYKERSVAYNNDRRARILNGGKLDLKFLRNLFESQRGLCFYCEQPLTEYKCVEHMTPLSRGGKNQIFNLVYSCRSCNSKKRQQTFEDYAIKERKAWWLNKWDYIFALAYRKTQEAKDGISQAIRT